MRLKILDILRLKEKLSGMVFTTKWVPGKKHLIADAFSRSPVDYPDTSDEELEKTLSIRSNLILEEVQEDKKSEDKILENLRRIAKKRPRISRPHQECEERISEEY